MEYIVINQCTNLKEKEYTKYFNQIYKKTKKILKLEKKYSLSIIFVDDQMIKVINRDYRQLDKATDVISFAALDNAQSFELEQAEIELGDIFISIEAIERQALEYQHSIQREASFLFTHGLLHLLGYDHQKKADEDVMFSLQDTILNDIIIK